MLDLEVIPERSLGCPEKSWEFILGMHFSQAVAIIQSQVGTIKNVQVLYSDQNLLNVDLIINIPLSGMRLIFDPISQRLKAIEIFNMKLVRLRYCGNYFNSPEILPSIEQIENSFGSTHPAVYDAVKNSFALNFRGLTFYFFVDSKTQPNQANHGLSSLHFGPGNSPIVTRMTLYCGNSFQECKAPPLPISCYNKQLYVESATVIRNSTSGTKGLRLNIFTEGSVRSLEARKQCFTRDVLFGDTCQDVATNFGAPSRVFYKSEDKMKIHSPSAHKRVQRKSDFFFNYFTLGIDILFDARTQKAKKFILHTNFPGHYNFNIYHRCEFKIELNPDKTDQLNGSPINVTAYSKWDAISAKLDPSESPIVLHRSSSTNCSNIFGSTFCYGYQDIIFEVMNNGHIASVTFYNTSSQNVFSNWAGVGIGNQQQLNKHNEFEIKIN